MFPFFFTLLISTFQTDFFIFKKEDEKEKRNEIAIQIKDKKDKT